MKKKIGMQIVSLLEKHGDDYYIHVTFPATDPIMQEKDILPEAFSICYDSRMDVSTILNEGFQMQGYDLDPFEHEAIKNFVAKETVIG
jgi:hypothetical protein